MKPRKNMTGERFTRLVVIRFSHSEKYESAKYSCTHSFWECLCDCGNAVIVKRCHLVSGSIRSCGCLHSIERGEAAFNRVYARYKKEAKRNGREFLLEKEYFRYLTSQDCYYCGTHPNTIMKTTNCNGEYIYNGIDRIDSSKGYFVENCVPCCRRCNVAKNYYSLDSFKEWIVQVYNHIK